MPSTQGDFTELSNETIIKHEYEKDAYWTLTENTKSINAKKFLLAREELLELVDYILYKVMTGEERHGIWNMLETSYSEDNK